MMNKSEVHRGRRVTQIRNMDLPRPRQFVLWPQSRDVFALRIIRRVRR